MKGVEHSPRGRVLSALFLFIWVTLPPDFIKCLYNHRDLARLERDFDSGFPKGSTSNRLEKGISMI